MVPDPQAKSRHGVAMMVVLGVVIFFTMLGFMGLEMATKDSQVSGTLLDIKSKESAAWGGLNLAIGAMQANPTSLATELQKFIADSAQPSADKRQWLSFSGGSFSLVKTDPGFYSIGSGNDKSAIKVRVVSVDLNGASGINSGNGLPITLECTGQGRNEQQLKIVASYRILGMDVPTITFTTDATLPRNALYLNGSVQNLNSALLTDAPIYSSGGYQTNSYGSITVKQFRVGGDLTLAGTGRVTVEKNSYIGGRLLVNSNFPLEFKENLGIGGGIFTLNDTLKVLGSLNVYGVPADFPSWAAGKPLIIRGAQLYIKDEAFGPYALNTLNAQGPIIVAGNTFFDRSFQTMSAARDSFYGFLQIKNVSTTNQATFQGPVYAGSIRILGANSPVQVRPSNDSVVVVNDFIISEPTAALQFSNTTALRVGGTTVLANGVSSWGLAGSVLQTKGPLRMKHNTTGGNPGAKLEAWDTVTVNGTISGTFGTFKATAPRRTFRVQSPATGPFPPASTMTNQSGATISGSGTAFPLPVPAQDAEATPKSLLQLGMTAQDTSVTLANNPPDTIKISGPAPFNWDSKVVNISAYMDSATPKINSNAVTGAQLSALFAFLKSRNLLTGGSTGYLILRINVPLTFLSSDITKFVGKAVFIIDNNVAVSYAWPGCNSSNDIQVIYLPAGSANCNVCTGSGSLSEFGTTGPFYGYLAVEKNVGYSLLVRWSTDTSHVTNWYGAISLGFATNMVGSNSGGKLHIKLADPASQAIFNDLSTIGIFRPANASGSGASNVVTTSTKTLVARSTASSLQFVRVGEFR
ncbi:MAG: hypothetical protein IPK50_00675 [Fibrobacterota bacterium]|nr:MAG: hypothetical protein IPK50_00675 [Fibrobacterota bacterium]